MAAKQDDFGMFDMSIFEKIRLLTEWTPLLARLQTVIETEDPHDRAVAVVSALRWAAGRTETEMDDEALAHVEAVLSTKEGESAFEWIVKKIGETEK
jgi:hypothetical protein